MIYLRIAAALAVLALLGYGAHIYKKAQRLDQVQAEYTQYRGAVAARDKEAAKARADAESRSARLALTLAGVSKELNELRSNPIKSVVYREKPAKDGVCSDPRAGDDFLRVWNAASDASTVHNPR